MLFHNKSLIQFHQGGRCMKKIRLKAPSIFSFCSFLVFFIPLFLVNGPIWLWFLFFFWCVTIPSFILVLYQYRRTKRKNPGGIQVAAFLIFLLLIQMCIFPLFVLPVSYIKAEFNKTELKKTVQELTKNKTTDEEKIKAILAWFNHDGGTSVANTFS